VTRIPGQPAGVVSSIWSRKLRVRKCVVPCESDLTDTGDLPSSIEIVMLTRLRSTGLTVVVTLTP